jgi:hypothetical protein
MQDYEKLGAFYLGRERDSGATLLYESKHLTTHAVCVGMTGSGKTGLCVGLLEEAAIDGIPALVIDPKGDLGNLLLTFPRLEAADFRPWVDEDEARRKGVDVETFAAQTAERWRNGLAEWDQDGGRIERLRAAADFTIYTPGSDAGVPVSILGSFQAPDAATRDDREAFRDRIQSTAASLLGLAGVKADAMAREFVLLSSILDHAWRQGQDLDLAALIGMIQQPPFTKVGVLDLDNFYPAKERFGLAMALNSLLASPGFEAWLEGEALNLDRLLYTPAGKPRIAIVSIAHLSDSERMFFVALLLNEVLGWMRRQAGTSSLRAILYMDEIFGYFPPVAEPPSKKPLLTLLKQARAFGLGVVLATQNPGDLDYKGLANTGTWFIGRLQTERDKMRVLEGLQGAAEASGGRFDKAEMDALLSGLGARVFLLNNVHAGAPEVFSTRWCMSYLRGPMTRPQIRQLMSGRVTPAGVAAAAPAASAAASAAVAGAAKPVLPPGIQELFVPLHGALHYEPCVFGAAQVELADAKLGVSELRDVLFAAPVNEGVAPVDWAQSEALDLPLNELLQQPAPGATFGELPAAAANVKNYAAWQKMFTTWLSQNSVMELWRSAALKEVSHPGEDERDFRIRLLHRAHEVRDAETEKLRQKYASKFNTLNDRLMRARQKVELEKEQVKSQTMNSMLSIGSSLLGAFLGKKTVSAANVGRIGTAARSAGRIGKEKADVARAEESVEAVEQQLAALEAQFKEEVAAVTAFLDPANERLEKVTIKPKRTGIQVRFVALGWR